jgi:hypothetical protein
MGNRYIGVHTRSFPSHHTKAPAVMYSSPPVRAHGAVSNKGRIDLTISKSGSAGSVGSRAHDGVSRLMPRALFSNLLLLSNIII